MITKIKLNSCACYKDLTSLETDKKVNLVYGLNGTGKTTLSDYLYEDSNPKYSKCSIEGFNNEEIYVYNQRFIRDHFYEPGNLKGIFTLSKENKDIEEKISEEKKKIVDLEKEKEAISNELKNINNDLKKKEQRAEEKTWEIKKKIVDENRVLDFCLLSLKKKKLIFNKLLNMDKPLQKPKLSVDNLKKEAETIKGSSANKLKKLPAINFLPQSLELSQLFQKVIIGNKNSVISELINQLENSDWVNEGAKFLPDRIEKNEMVRCPFCQKKTITKQFNEDILSYFDKTYENDIINLKKILSEYNSGIDELPKKEVYISNPFILEKKNEFENYYNAITQSLMNNKSKISEKIKTPSQKISLCNSFNIIDEFNQFINAINKTIALHNNKVENKEESLNNINIHFWDIMRWDFDQTISHYLGDQASIKTKMKELKKKKEEVENKISIYSKNIEKQLKKTVNIEEAVFSINNGLIELGISGFKIEKHNDKLYKIVREEQCENTFKTLSEGEKMIISFLYFRELCKGKQSASNHLRKKIVVMDDPISSLSHIYTFNIGQLIKNDFFINRDYEQIFVLTHNLYFFYELTDINKERRKDKQKLFRLIKNNSGSHISEMKYEEIQNDYHSYWTVIKDDKQPPALIANCMRNIIEYFFNFVEKQDLNNVFQKKELQKPKYQAFCRYINRESHSLGQNIIDFKEFNYDVFKDALGLVFKESGYQKHYDKMMKKLST